MTSSSEGIIDTLSVALTIGIICGLGVLSNIVVILLAYRKLSESKGSTNLFIINLAVSDIVLSGLTMPLILLDANIADFTKEDIECKLKMALPLFNICSSVFTMVVMSFDRLGAVVKGKAISHRAVKVSVACVWLASFVLTAPQLYEYSLVEKWEERDNETEFACSSEDKDPAFKKVYATLILILAYLMPVAALIKNYVHVIVHVVKTSNLVRGQVSRAKIRVLRTIITITVVFVLLWLPFFVLFTIEEVTGTDDSSEFSTTPHIIKQVFIALSGVSNPVTYFALMPDYRRACTRLFGSAHCCVSAVQPIEGFGAETRRTETGAVVTRPRAGSSKCDSGQSLRKTMPGKSDENNSSQRDGEHAMPATDTTENQKY